MAKARKLILPGGPPRASLKLEDFSDRELLFALEDHADASGRVTSVHLAEGMGLAGFDSPQRNISIRLAWLKRYGAVDRSQDPETKEWGWSLSAEGKAALHGSLKAADRRALDHLDSQRLWSVMEIIGERMQTASQTSATLAQRQWRYAGAQRKRRGVGR